MTPPPLYKARGRTTGRARYPSFASVEQVVSSAVCKTVVSDFVGSIPAASTYENT